ncbi:MAG: short-chain dehydrogenase [Glaciihabitans sp.]|nr:short-chain dehydrogenase [Glaciihabitans sp.]
MSSIVLTGASSGIGAAAARSLSEAGWDVAVVGRDPERTGAVARAVHGRAFVADYDQLDDVRALADQLLSHLPTIDVLANNAGGLVSRRGTSADGHEQTFQHNHLAPFLLTNLLLPALDPATSRVLNTSSVANRFGRIRLDNLDGSGVPYVGGWSAYASAKLAAILFTRQLAVRTGITAYAFHPGFVATSFGHDSAASRLLLALSRSQQISAEQGAAPLLALATGPDLSAPSGTYFDGLYPGGAVASAANDEALASRLWETSASMVGLAD